MPATVQDRELGVPECWAFLRTARVGSLAYVDDALPTVRPVRFEVVDDGDVLLMRPVLRSGHASPAQQVVAFEVHEVDAATDTGWSVLVVGRAVAASPDVRHAGWRVEVARISGHLAVEVPVQATPITNR